MPVRVLKWSHSHNLVKRKGDCSWRSLMLGGGQVYYPFFIFSLVEGLKQFQALYWHQTVFYVLRVNIFKVVNILHSNICPQMLRQRSHHLGLQLGQLVFNCILKTLHAYTSSSSKIFRRLFHENTK